jgi:hypothetical protein
MMNFQLKDLGKHEKHPEKFEENLWSKIDDMSHLDLRAKPGCVSNVC